MLDINCLVDKALNLEFLSLEEGMFLYKELSLPSLMALANDVRQKLNPGKRVGWIIDRNVNITNVCISACRFCNFHCNPNSEKAYITKLADYKTKIDEMIKLGGNQLLLQGGLHPHLGLDFYVTLFKKLKEMYPTLKLHALGPPEIVHIAKLEKSDYQTILKALMAAGLDSLPGAGAEILTDRVRKQLSGYKCNSDEWLDVMLDAHKLGLTTSATMMFGHIETLEERFEHLIRVREVQALKPFDVKGFISFILWPFQSNGTVLEKKHGIINNVSADEYIRMLAISRLMLPNITNIQVSWLTVGKDVASVCLHGGANDMGSIMIEENVVSSAGADYSLDAKGIQDVILKSGFVPVMRNQQYEFLTEIKQD